MTCIIGATNSTASNTLTTVNKHSKIMKRGNVVIGTAGSCRTQDLLKYEFKVPKLTKDRNHHAYMVKNFVPATEAVYSSYYARSCVQHAEFKEILDG